jgi:apurinic endonuclease APN1
MSHIGAHASIAGSIIKGIKYVADELHGSAIQIFLGSSHMASMKSKSKLSDEDAKEIKKYIKDNDLYLVVHACYLLNFCKFPADDSKIQYAINNLIYDVNMAKQLGASGVVVHIGYQMALERDEAYDNMVDGIKKVIDKTPNGAMIILETPAGQGSQIATTVKDFAEMFNKFPAKYKKRLGICVDTCHIFSAGAQIHSVKGVQQYFKDFDKLIGKKHLVLFHINDSKQPLNSRKDQHQGIGHGYIYNKEMGGDIKALEVLTQYAKKNKIPMVLETHGGASASGTEKNPGSYQDEIMLLNKFAGNSIKSIKVPKDAKATIVKEGSKKKLRLVKKKE